MRENITFTTQDNVRLAGHWYPVVKPEGWALLLHMMPATKESYAALAAELQKRGIASLAIDFRGHGESQGGPLGYNAFGDAEQQAKIQDVHAALLWLEDKAGKDDVELPKTFFEHPPANYLYPRFVVVGASIGANLALQAARDNPTIAGVVLLSPGLNYRGIKTDTLALDIVTQQERNASLPKTPVFLAAGGANDEYSTQSVRQLAAILGPRATVRTFENTGHGTAMFDNEPSFLAELVQWIVGCVH